MTFASDQHRAADVSADASAASVHGTPGAADNGSAHTAPGSHLSAEMEREIDRAMRAATDPHAAGSSGDARSEAAAGAATLPGPKPAIRGPRVVQAGREHRHGRVVSVGPEDLFLEFGPKELGVAPRKQWPDEQLPKVGEDLEVVVDRFEASEQLYMCSRPGAVQKAAWEMLEPGQVVEARVTGVNKGGLELEIANHRAFMPAGRVDVRHIPDLSVFVGEKLTCRITQVDRSGRGNILLSRKELIAAELKDKKAKLRESLAEGQEIDGVVRKIMPFGAFVDIGGVDGLVHISDISHDRINRVEDALKEGETVKVRILKLDWDKDRISLGIKQAQPDPFSTAAADITAGAEISGRVTKLMEFGAFVELAPGVEGLIHISELSWRRVGKAGDVVKPDQVITVKVLEVDADRRRIGLSLKQMTEQPAAPSDGPGGGRGKGRRGEQGRSVEEIRQETPAQRRAREKFQAEQRAKGEKGLKSGLGDVGGIGLGEIGTLKLG